MAEQNSPSGVEPPDDPRAGPDLSRSRGTGETLATTPLVKLLRLLWRSIVVVLGVAAGLTLFICYRVGSVVAVIGLIGAVVLLIYNLVSSEPSWSSFWWCLAALAGGTFAAGISSALGRRTGRVLADPPDPLAPQSGEDK